MMGERSAAAFNDPRSRIIIDDAKSFSPAHTTNTISSFPSRPIRG